VILDQVQFPQGTTWLTRNRFKNDQGSLWITVPVWKKGLGLQRINEVRICHEGRWQRKHLSSLKTAYARAPYFLEHSEFLQHMFSSRYEKLIHFNQEIILYLMRFLEISTQVLLLSDLDAHAGGDQLLVELCRKTGASHFLVQSSARKYLDPEAFSQAGIQLVFFNTSVPVYPQLWGNFIPNLSVFDLILNCGPKARDIFL
jgi:hypothetical protein